MKVDQSILITGASGFLGQIIIQEIEHGMEIQTLGRHARNTYRADISHSSVKFNDAYDLVIHAAGKAHSVPKSEAEKQEFFQVNEQGTQNLLNALVNLPKAFVFISTVAVYGRESGEHIAEDEPLKGDSPYAASKIAAEQMVRQWGDANGVKTTILRLPLIAGPNPPGNLGAMIKAIRKGYYFRIGDGLARRSVVLASDVARIIPKVAEVGGTYNLTDGYHPSFREVETCIAKAYHKKIRSIPLGLIKPVAKLGDFIPGSPINSYRLEKMTSTLTFSDEKARRLLDWNPKRVIDGWKVK